MYQLDAFTQSNPADQVFIKFKKNKQEINICFTNLPSRTSSTCTRISRACAVRTTRSWRLHPTPLVFQLPLQTSRHIGIFNLHFELMSTTLLRSFYIPSTFKIGHQSIKN